MAGGVVVAGGGGKDYPGTFTFNVFITCLAAAVGSLIFCYNLGISGGVTSMDPFLKKFFPDVFEKETIITTSDDQYCTFNNETLTLFMSSLYLTVLISCLAASTITRALGCRITYLFGGILFVIGSILSTAAFKVWMLIVGRVFLGLGIECVNQSMPIYLSEVAPHRYCGALNIIFQLMITIGILVANLLNYGFAKIEGGWGWRLSLGGALVPAVIIIGSSLILPETPNSLIERNHYEEAKAQLLKLRGGPNVDAEFDDIVKASEASKKDKHPWRNIVQGKYRAQRVMSICIPMFQQLTGMNVIVFYAPVLFKTISFRSNVSLISAAITGVVNCMATLVSISTVDKFGR